MSTLKLIAQSLGWDMIPPLPEPARTDKPDDSGMLLTMLIVSFIAGMVFVVNWLFYAQVIPPDFLSILGLGSTLGGLRLYFAGVYIMTGVFFYLGFFMLSKYYHNRLLQISSLIILILLPLSAFLDIAEGFHPHSYVRHLHSLSLILMSANGAFFGAGLLLHRFRYRAWYHLTGVLQILITPAFLIPVPLVQMLGLWLALPYFGLLILLLLLEGIHQIRF